MTIEGEVMTNKDILVEINESKPIILLLLQVLSADDKSKTINFDLTKEVTDVLYKLYMRLILRS